jgi:hypothetical protein
MKILTAKQPAPAILALGVAASGLRLTAGAAFASTSTTVHRTSTTMHSVRL